MPDLLIEAAKYSALAALAVVGVYVLARVGTLAVLQSINDYRTRHRDVYFMERK